MSARPVTQVLWINPYPEVTYRAAAASYKVGDRVMAAVHTDTWARGDRFGIIEKITIYRQASTLHVRMDRSGRLVRFSPDNLISTEELNDHDKTFRTIHP